jgi:hypothetical protein
VKFLKFIAAILAGVGCFFIILSLRAEAVLGIHLGILAIAFLILALIFVVATIGDMFLEQVAGHYSD